MAAVVISSSSSSSKEETQKRFSNSTSLTEDWVARGSHYTDTDLTDFTSLINTDNKNNWW